METFVATKYYSEKYGEVKLRYKVHITVTDSGGYCEYTSANSRKCKMNFYKNDGGYLWTSVALAKGNYPIKKLSARINRLVYSNVKGAIPKGYEIDHIDKNRLNNYSNNLRCITKSENNLNRNILGEQNSFSKLTLVEVRDILEALLSKKMRRKELAEKYNVSESTIKSIRNARNWKNFTKDIFVKYGIQK